jgi:hypothetical protein
VRPTLGAIQVTDVIQTLFPELKVVQVDEFEEIGPVIY